jgi:enoyl-CoA hydratase/carnithine racemase
MFRGLDAASARAWWHDQMRLVSRIEALPCPTVFAAHGLCYTWGFELALACDALVVAQSAQFAFKEAVLGLTPALGGTQRLADRVGRTRAAWAVLTGDPISANQLDRWGAVSLLLPDEDFDRASRAVAERLAAGATRAHAVTKQILQLHERYGLRAADDATAELASTLLDSADARGALSAFLEHGPRSSFTFEGA